MNELLRREELPEMMNMSENVARELLESYGVRPIDLGPGRGRGLRWHRGAVRSVIDTLHAEAQVTATSKRKVHPKEVRPVLGKTPRELYAEINQRGAVQ